VAAVFVDFPKNKRNFLHKNKLDIVRQVQLGGGGCGSRQHWPMDGGAYMTSDEQVEWNGSHEVVAGEFFSWLWQSPALAYGRRRLYDQ